MRPDTITLRRALAAAAICGVTAFAAGCGSNSSNDSATSGSTSSAGASTAAATDAGASTTADRGGTDVLGTPNKASGTPVVFGALNIEASNGAAFPQARQAMDATVKYINEYRGGIGGHPVQIKWCITDGAPATSGNCAKKLLAAKVTAILGATDLNNAVTMPIYDKSDIAYVGGMNFTPFEGKARNSVVFNDAAQLGNVLSGLKAAKDLGGKNIAVIAQGDTQGEFSAKTYTIPAIESAGSKATLVPAPPTQADLSSVVASAMSNNPDVIVIESPSQCVPLLTALKSAGNTAPVVSIDPCASKPVIEASGGGADGLYFYSPFQLPSTGTDDAKLAAAILEKYAPPDINANSPAYAGMNTVMNVQAAFKDADPAELTTDKILSTLRAGSDHPNFLAEPYTCDGKAVPALPAICNAKYYAYQIKNGEPVQVDTETHDEGLELVK
jgi:branched-chain amino acid transport system substrate-binding protein